MTDVRVDFPINMYGKESPERILRAAEKWKVKELLVIGITEDGDILVSGTTSVLPEINFYLDAAKIKILRSAVS